MRGSILVLCLVFMAALSVAALGAMQLAWSGQMMASAYLAHHQALIAVERELVRAENLAWQYWLQNEELPAADQVKQTAEEVNIVFEPGAIPDSYGCQPMFSLSATIKGADPSRGNASVSSRWFLCCDQPAGCESSDQLRRIRYRSRQPFSN